MDRCTDGRWTHSRTQRRVGSGEVRRRYHYFGHALQRKTKKENNLIMENQQQAPVTQGVNDNKLIAEFMGLSIKEGVCYYTDSNDMFPMGIEVEEPYLPYHTSWDWLMPVVERISDIKHYTLSSTIEFLSEFYYRNSDNADGLEGKKEFHKAVVEFIKWYNKQEL